MKSVFFRILLIFSCVIAFAGCEHKDLCYDHGHSVEIEIHFNWDAAPDADPNTMVVSFFSLDGKYVTSREFTSRDGGKAKLEEGEYRILFHNGEMDNVNEVVDSYDRYGLNTNEETLLAPMSRNMKAPPRPETSAKEPVRATAETVWAGKKEYVMIERGRKGQVVELSPEEATARYTVEVVNVENLRDNIDISAALSGLSERLNISSSSAVGQPVTVPFSVERKDATTIEARFLTFGHCPDDNTVSHILSIYTSSKVYFNFDVTDQVHDAPDDKNIYVRIDGLKLPVDGQDVSPSIDDWGDAENIDIDMV
ncbi:MAG: DUF5119 domain-containing protein [Bacteroides sp.]|nr:DUF5119 domain-containing protein [Bacteroides sp.]MCM1389255.1 DUF5119 domain-containing protein [Bacteroides sp.]